MRVLSPGRRPYKTKDGWVGVLPYTERNWTKVLTEIGRPDGGRARLVQGCDRAQQARRRALRHPGRGPARPHHAEWLAIFERLDIPHAPVRTPQDLLSDPHLADVGFFDTHFAADTPVRRTLRQAVNVEDVGSAPGSAPAAARRRHRGRAARGRLQRGRDRGACCRPPRRPDRAWSLRSLNCSRAKRRPNITARLQAVMGHR